VTGQLSEKIRILSAMKAVLCILLPHRQNAHSKRANPSAHIRQLRCSGQHCVPRWSGCGAFPRYSSRRKHCIHIPVLNRKFPRHSPVRSTHNDPFQNDRQSLTTRAYRIDNRNHNAPGCIPEQRDSSHIYSTRRARRSAVPSSLCAISDDRQNFSIY
jgi:hypothetical protein